MANLILKDLHLNEQTVWFFGQVSLSIPFTWWALLTGELPLFSSETFTSHSEPTFSFPSFYGRDWSDHRVGFSTPDLLEVVTVHFWRPFVTWALIPLLIYSNLAKMNKLGSYREIQNVVWPKGYKKKKFYPFDDIALVELASPFKWSSSVKPACLPTSDLVDEYEGQLMVSFRSFNEDRPLVRLSHLLSQSLGKPKVRVYIAIPQCDSRSQATRRYSVSKV